MSRHIAENFETIFDLCKLDGLGPSARALAVLTHVVTPDRMALIAFVVLRHVFEEQYVKLLD